MRKIGLLLIAALLLAQADEGRGENPHQAADRCFDEFTADCDSTCGYCHQTIGIEPAPRTGVADFYGAIDENPEQAEPPRFGDMPLCMECHPEKMLPGINHPVGIPYIVDDLNGEFRPSVPGPFAGDTLEHGPLEPFPGPKLYCDESGPECWIFCTTCHNPHRGRVGMLRTYHTISMLCLACHRK